MRALKYALSFRWANALSEAAGYLSGIALVLATLAMMHGVVTRYFLKSPTVWQTEISIYLLVFVTFVGAAYGLKHHAHVGVDLLVERLPMRAQLVVRVATAVLAMVVVGAVLYTAYGTWLEAYEGDFRTSTVLSTPLWIVYAILPVGMLLVLFQYLYFTIDAVQCLLAGGDRLRSAALLGQGNVELNAAVETTTDPAADRVVNHPEERQRDS